MKHKDSALNEGCSNCKNYCGKQPVNVPNFRCKAGVKAFKVYICDKFCRKN